MNRFYQILNWISTGGNTASRPSLLKHFSGELIDECLDNGYLVEIRRNAFNEPVYIKTSSITSKVLFKKSAITHHSIPSINAPTNPSSNPSSHPP